MQQRDILINNMLFFNVKKYGPICAKCHTDTRGGGGEKGEEEENSSSIHILPQKLKWEERDREEWKEKNSIHENA